MRRPLQAEELTARECPARFRLDYSYDTAGFFNDTARRAALQRAANDIDVNLQDSLTAIVPGGGNTWRASFQNTLTNQTVTLTNPTIAADEIVVYVAGGELPGASELGIASGGSRSAFGSQTWLETVLGRGQPGALTQTKTDTAPWGGFVAFDSTSNWYFGTGSPNNSQFDFASVVRHELVHILGFGIGDGAYDRYVNQSAGVFLGPNSIASFGGPVPLSPEQGHWDSDVRSAGLTPIEVPSIPAGTQRGLTPLDYAALHDVGWQVGPVVPPVVPPPLPPPPPPPPAVPPGTTRADVRFFVGAGEDAASAVVSGRTASGAVVWTATAFNNTVTGGVRVASGDVNNDGILDVAVGTGAGATATVRVLDGRNGRSLFDFNPFGTFTGGVFIALADLTGDNKADLIISPDRGGGPRVRIFSAGNTFTQVADFFGIDDVNFRGGARVAAGDVNGDGDNDLVVAAGTGGGPRVAVFDGSELTTTGGPKLTGDFFVFEQGLRNGAYIAVGDLDGDGKAEVIAGGGPGGGPRISAYSGAALLGGQLAKLVDYFAGDVNSRDGVRVAAAKVNGDNRSDILTGSGRGTRLAAYLTPALTAGGNPIAAIDIAAFPNEVGGVFVG